MRVERIDEMLRLLFPLRSFAEKALIEPHLCGERMLCRHPLNRSLDLAVRRSAAAPRIRIIGAAEFRDLARCILDDLITFNNIGMLEADLAARLLTQGIDLNAGWVRRAMAPTSAIAPELRGIVVDGMGVDTRGEVLEGLTRRPRPRVTLAEPSASSTVPARPTAAPRSVPTSTVSQMDSDTRRWAVEEMVSQSDELLGEPIALDLTRALERQRQVKMTDQSQGVPGHFPVNARLTRSQSERAEQVTTINDIVMEYLSTSTRIADRQAETIHSLLGGVLAESDGNEAQEFIEQSTQPGSGWLLEAGSQHSTRPTSPNGVLDGEVEEEGFQISSAFPSSHTTSLASTRPETLAESQHDSSMPRTEREPLTRPRRRRPVAAPVIRFPTSVMLSCLSLGSGLVIRRR